MESVLTIFENFLGKTHAEALLRFVIGLGHLFILFITTDFGWYSNFQIKMALFLKFVTIYSL